MHCRWQLACCRCSCPAHDDLLDVDADVETILLHKMLSLEGSILCLDAACCDDVGNATHNILDVLLVG